MCDNTEKNQIFNFWIKINTFNWIAKRTQNFYLKREQAAAYNYVNFWHKNM